MGRLPDADIDVKERERAAGLFQEAVVASQVKDDRLVKHNTSLHFQRIPQDPDTGLSAFPYQVAEEFGYHKVDIIPNHVYDQIHSEEELQRLIDADVNWDWFQDERFFGVGGLTHIGSYRRLCQKFPPRSLLDVAALLAIIRPRMRHLQVECHTIDEVKKRCWNKDEGPQKEYFFKKSHSVAFAMLVLIHAQLIARKFKMHVYEADGEFFI